MQRLTFSDLCGFTDKQWQATEAADTYKYTLFGGARGPGKSYWLRWYLLRFLLRSAEAGLRGVKVMLACEDYPALKDRQIGKIAKEFPDWLGTLKSTKSDGLGFHLHEAYGAGSILLRNLDDPSRYQSAEFAAIAIDELTKNPESTFNILRGSLRWPGIPHTKFVAATNPEANWVRDFWIEKRFPDNLMPLAGQFVFVPALPDDNPYLNEEYWLELETLPEHLRQAWRFGDWYAGVVGLVYPEFTSENVTDEEPDFDLPYELAFDDGYIDPRCVLFIQRTGSRILVFDEIYHSKRLEEETIREVIDRSIAYARRAGLLDEEDDTSRQPDNWDTLSLPEQARWVRERGIPYPELAIGSTEANQLMKRFRMADIPARGGTHKVIEGIPFVRGLIRDGRGRRLLQVHRRCTNLLDEIRIGYKYPEDVKPSNAEKPLDGNDHAADALRYWVWKRARR